MPNIVIFVKKVFHTKSKSSKVAATFFFKPFRVKIWEMARFYNFFFSFKNSWYKFRSLIISIEVR
jgi:hypothetical protein